MSPRNYESIEGNEQKKLFMENKNKTNCEYFTDQIGIAACVRKIVSDRDAFEEFHYILFLCNLYIFAAPSRNIFLPVDWNSGL